jgi:hypothetical protein
MVVRPKSGAEENVGWVEHVGVGRGGMFGMGAGATGAWAWEGEGRWVSDHATQSGILPPAHFTFTPSSPSTVGLAPAD